MHLSSDVDKLWGGGTSYLISLAFVSKMVGSGRESTF